MKQSVIVILIALAVSSLAPAQVRNHKMQEDLLKVEKEFSEAIVENDAEAVGQFLADDWIIIDPDGSIIDKARFLDVIKSGTLTHEMMESSDPRVRIYGNTAVITALTTSKGKYMGKVLRLRSGRRISL